ncbi:WAT1-related protein At4g30420 [Linum perenne]
MENYKPEIAMTSLQFSYAVISIAGRAALLEGLSPRVFVVYRQAIAAITISPIAYFSSRGKQGGPSIGIRSFALIFLAALIGVTGALTMALIKGPQLFLNNGLGGNEEDWLLGCCFLFASACCWSIWLILQVPVTTTYPDPLSVSAWMCFLGALHLIGAIGVVVGLYAVLWGKSKDYAKKVEGEIDPKPTKDETQVRTMLIDEECLDETKSKICDIEEPLLCNKI